MILAIDAGNTSVKFGLGRLNGSGWLQTLRLATHPGRTGDEWYSLLQPHISQAAGGNRGLQGVGICSVVPAVTESLERLSIEFLDKEPVRITNALDLPIQIATDFPELTGGDRIANAVAAFEQVGGPVITVDMGTATKVDATSATGRFLGGAICPGLGISMEMLGIKAAQLAEVELEEPAAAIGSNTSTALQSGVVLGHRLMIEGLVAKEMAELDADCPVLVTGGYAAVIESRFAFPHDWQPQLTLDGIRFALRCNL